MLASLALALTIQSTATFTVSGDQFLLNGKPFVVRSGEMHYPRVPQAYWRTRFKQAKAMGLNTICTYVFWNLHEDKPGKFNFKNNLDLSRYIKTAQEEGLYVIVRPGPYVCTELDFGGFPAWLLKDRSMKVRSNDDKFLTYVDRYFAEVGKAVKPHLLKNGGNVIMAQVENEYGSYGSDHVYMSKVKGLMEKNGFDCLLFTSDGPGQGMLNGGTLPGITPTINFGGGAPKAFEELAKFRAGTPRMIGEYWCGWFDHWGKGHHKTNIENHVSDIKWCLENNVSFNLYMFHGGTNWGFMQGSNGGASEYNVDTTSYDYDSPVDESGRLTPKYWAFRNAIKAGVKETLPEPPSDTNPITIKPFKLTKSASLLDNLPKPMVSRDAQTFEDLGQNYGLVLYRTTVQKKGEKQSLKLENLRDYATVFVNGTRVGELDRRLQQETLDVAFPEGTSTLDILVESKSRVNFGGLLPTERKGLTGKVTLGDTELKGWEHFLLPLSSSKSIKFVEGQRSTPAFYKGTFEVEVTGDTFLDMRGWNKGFVWVNGINLGRFWKIGPQQTLFLPGVWLKKGKNEVVVYDNGYSPRRTLQGLASPILDQVERTVSRVHRKPGQTVDLSEGFVAATGQLQNSSDNQIISFPSAIKTRYIAFEALSEHNDGPWTALAELNMQGPDGKNLDRSGWKILYADSEELDNENGSAANLIDLQPTTIWHTNWSGDAPNPPHVVVIDLGKETEVKSLSVLGRQVGVNGRVKGYKVYTSLTPFKGL